MSKLFKLSGCLRQGDTWPLSGPSFTGEMVMGELPIFWGCCKEFADGDTLKAGATSYLVGGFLKGRRPEFYFYKMYDRPPEEMLLCMVSQLADGQGVWATPEKSGGNFVKRNIAQVAIESLPYSDSLEREISSTFQNGCPALVGFPDRLTEVALALR